VWGRKPYFIVHGVCFIANLYINRICIGLHLTNV